LFFLKVSTTVATVARALEVHVGAQTWPERALTAFALTLSALKERREQQQQTHDFDNYVRAQKKNNATSTENRIWFAFCCATAT
jgi:hypothetical protein